MKLPVFTGSGVALITPMDEKGRVNCEEFAKLCEAQIHRGTDALVVCGTTGESATLTDEEHLELFRIAVHTAAGRVPVIAGTGSNDTQHASRLSAAAAECGVDALLLVTPYYNKTCQQGLYLHFRTVAYAAQLPVILYNVPSRTGVDLLPETVQRLCDEPWIVGIKEATGSAARAAMLRSLCGSRMAVYSGNDDMTLPILALGGRGVISVAANLLPELTHALCAAWFEGDTVRAEGLALHLTPIISAMFCDVNPMPIKYLMNRVGWKAGPCRLPLCALSAEKRAQLDAMLRRYDLI